MKETESNRHWEVLERGRGINQAIQVEVAKVVFGKENNHLVQAILVALFARGHVLVEAPVGTGKTATCLAVARAIDGGFSRIQFVPDMLPSSITGFLGLNRETGRNEVHHGPLYHSEYSINVVLADEINRATPKTQSAMLEAMGEGQVTIEGQKFRLADPFTVLATQNPIEHDGTYPLPQAQLDRFLMRVDIGDTSRETLKAVLADSDYWRDIQPRLEKIQPVANLGEILSVREAIFANVHVGEELDDYICSLIEATRVHPAVAHGSSPRGAINLRKVAQVAAFLAGIREQRLPSGEFVKGYFVTPDDVRPYAGPVLAHRIVMKPGSQFAQHPTTPAQIIQEILNAVKPD